MNNNWAQHPIVVLAGYAAFFVTACIIMGLVVLYGRRRDQRHARRAAANRARIAGQATVRLTVDYTAFRRGLTEPGAIRAASMDLLERELNGGTQVR